MFTPRAAWIIALCAGLPSAIPAHALAQERFGFGREATAHEIEGWNIDARPDGVGLPQGSGTAAQGRDIYNARCVACHAEDLDGPMGALAGGIGSLAAEKPLRAVGSYWPYATTLWDYVYRAMPFDAPQSLSADEVYAVSAYVLFRNGIIKEDEVMNADTLARVKLPNRDGFYDDPRPDVFNTACQHDCKQGGQRPVQGPPPGQSDTTGGATGIGGGASSQ